MADSQLGVENALERCRRNEYRINKSVLSSTMAVEAILGKDIDGLMRCCVADALAFDVVDPLRQLWYGEPNAVSNVIGYAKHYSRSHDAVIPVYDEAGSVIETHEHKGEFKRARKSLRP